MLEIYLDRQSIKTVLTEASVEICTCVEGKWAPLVRWGCVESIVQVELESDWTRSYCGNPRKRSPTEQTKHSTSASVWQNNAVLAVSTRSMCMLCRCLKNPRIFPLSYTPRWGTCNCLEMPGVEQPCVCVWAQSKGHK